MIEQYNHKEDYSNNLVGKYNFNDNDNTCRDISRSTNNGTYIGINKLNENNLRFVKFNGTAGSCIKFNNHIIPKFNKSIYFEIRKNSKPDKYEWIFAQHTTNPGTSGYDCNIRADGTLSFNIRNKDEKMSLSAPTLICDDKWHRVLITIDSDNLILKIFIDNLTIPKDEIKINMSLNFTPTNFLLIGKIHDNDNYNLIGDLSNLEIYNRVIEFNMYEFSLIDGQFKYVYEDNLLKINTNLGAIDGTNLNFLTEKKLTLEQDYDNIITTEDNKKIYNFKLKDKSYKSVLEGKCIESGGEGDV